MKIGRLEDTVFFGNILHEKFIIIHITIVVYDSVIVTRILRLNRERNIPSVISEITSSSFSIDILQFDILVFIVLQLILLTGIIGLSRGSNIPSVT